MVGRLDRWLPVSGDVAFFKAPLDDVVRAMQAQAAHWGTSTAVQAADGAFPEILRRLEPIDGRKHLLVENGAWTAMFHAAAAPDMDSWFATLTERLGSRAVLATATPNVYGRGKGANTALSYSDPAVSDEAFGAVRSVSLTYAEDGWDFGSSGEPQPWEDLSAYTAKRVADRLPPELVHRYLDALGIPPLDGPGWGSRACLVTESPPAPEPRRRGLLGRQRDEPDPEPDDEPVWETIAELHEQMYGDG